MFSVFCSFLIVSTFTESDRKYSCYADMPKHMRDKIDEERRLYNKKLAKERQNTEKETFYLNQLKDYIKNLKSDEIEISRLDYYRVITIRDPDTLKLLENSTSDFYNIYIVDRLAKTLLGFPVKISDNPKFKLKEYV